MSKKLLSVLLVALLVLSPFAIASASEFGSQNHKAKSHDADAVEKHSKKDHKEAAKVNDRDDDDHDDDDEGTPAPGTIYNINVSGDAAKKAKGEGHGDKKDGGHGKDKDRERDRDKKKTTEVKPASLSLKSKVQDGSEGRIKLKILSGTLKIGDTTYNIEDGKGKINKENNKIEFKAKAFSGGDDFELVLKGNHGGNVPESPGNTSTSVEFTSPQSKLASKWFLHLSGKIAIEGTAPSLVNRTTLAIAKSVNASTALGKANLRYLITFTNTGNFTARSINVTDTLPKSTSFVSSNGSIISISSSAIKFAAGNLSKGASKSIIIAANVNGTTPDGKALKNNVSVVWKNADGSIGGPVNAMATTTVLAPSLQIAKGVNATAAHQGNHLFYNITIVNNGHADAMISLNDTLPSGVILVTTSQAPNIISGNSLVWNTLMLAPGGKATITILVQVTTGTSGTIINKATVTYKNTNNVEFPQVSDQKSTLITAP